MSIKIVRKSTGAVLDKPKPKSKPKTRRKPRKIRPPNQRGGGNRGYARILGLGEKRVNEIHLLFYAGRTAKDVAEILQNDWLEFSDVNPSTLTRQLVRYRGDKLDQALVTDPNPKQLVDEELPPKALLVLRKVENKIDSHTALEELVLMQRDRLNKIYTHELKLPSVMDAVRKEVDMLAKLLQQLAGLQMDLGVIVRIPKKVSTEINILSDESAEQEKIITNSMKNLDQSMTATHKAFSLLEEIDASPIEDIEYTEYTDGE